MEDYNESDPNPYKYELTGEKIPRSPEWKLIIKLKHSYRQDGKVKGKSSRIITISYWDFIDQWIEEQSDDSANYDFYVPEERLDSALEKLKGVDGNSDILMQQLKDKLRPWQDKAMDQYKNSKEYGHAQRYIDAWKECVRLRQDAYLKECEERERQRKAEQESYREQARHHNERMGQGGGSLDFSDTEEQMFKEVWKTGYRALSIKFHPDKGGDEEQMKMLNGLKDKLGLLVA